MRVAAKIQVNTCGVRVGDGLGRVRQENLELTLGNSLDRQRHIMAPERSWIVDSGPIWGLALSAPLVLLLDRLFPAPRKLWVEPPASEAKGATA